MKYSIGQIVNVPKYEIYNAEIIGVEKVPLNPSQNNDGETREEHFDKLNTCQYALTYEYLGEWYTYWYYEHHIEEIANEQETS